jgi:hypothetical protein
LTEKSQIVRQLGERTLLLPTLLAEALAANDRLKLRLTLLQEASAQARQPGRAARSLGIERQAAGLGDPQFDATISGARALSSDRLHVPGARRLVAGMKDDLAAMLAPLEAAQAASYPALGQRLVALESSLPSGENDELTAGDIQAMASAPRNGADSVHLLIMAAHRELNALGVRMAVETIDRAHVSSIDPADRPRIRSFMAGVNRTAPLAFGHPGLGTTAVRSGPRLVIQNDIGVTDAHVMVIHVEERAVSVTYTDVHRRRAHFFMSMFDGKGVAWNSLAERKAEGLEEDAFFLVAGRAECADEAALLGFLEFLGSRLVFLIDWNKARKALQTFVAKNEAVDILKWAAAHDHGHRAFLELGGSELVFEAIRRAATGRIPYGTRLDAALGGESCGKFLRRVLRQTSEGLTSGRSVRLIRDEVYAELAELFDTAESAVLGLLVRHLGVTRTLASAIGESIADGGVAGTRSRLARRAKQIEEKADRLTLQAREMCARMRGADALRRTVDQVEDATDALDECAFLWSLVPAGDPLGGHSALIALSDIVLESIGHLVRATMAAACLPQGHRGDSAAALQAIDAVTQAERQADTAERAALGAFMAAPALEARSLVLGIELARALERSTDYLAHAAFSLRERVLEELST